MHASRAVRRAPMLCTPAALVLGALLRVTQHAVRLLNPLEGGGGGGLLVHIKLPAAAARARRQRHRSPPACMSARAVVPAVLLSMTVQRSTWIQLEPELETTIVAAASALLSTACMWECTHTSRAAHHTHCCLQPHLPISPVWVVFEHRAAVRRLYVVLGAGGGCIEDLVVPQRVRQATPRLHASMHPSRQICLL